VWRLRMRSSVAASLCRESRRPTRSYLIAPKRHKSVCKKERKGGMDQQKGRKGGKRNKWVWAEASGCLCGSEWGGVFPRPLQGVQAAPPGCTL